MDRRAIMNSPKNRRALSVAAALFNLSGLGLGYLANRRWVRWGIHLLLTIALLVAAFLADASKLPLLWIPVIVVWLIWMAFDGWRQAQRPAPEGGALPALLSDQSSWLLVAAAIMLLVLEAAGFIAYSTLGEGEFQHGMTAYREADCDQARMHFERVTTLYELTFSPIVERADARLAECELLLTADAAYQGGRYEEAIQLYQDYLALGSKETLSTFANNALAESYFDWATDLLVEDKYEAAIEMYSIVVEEYPGSPAADAADDPLSEAYFDWAMDLSEAGDYQAAIERFSTVLDDYAQTSAANTVDDPLSEAYLSRSAQLWDSHDYQEAVQSARTLLDDYPDTPSGQEAPEQIAQIYYDWAIELQESGSYEEAVDKSLLISDEFPRTTSAEAAPALAAEIYYEWANELLEMGEFQDAVETYEIIQADYAEFFSGQDLDSDIKSAHLAWATQLRQEAEYEMAIAQYQTLRDDYPETIAPEESDKLVLETLLEWGQDLYREAEFSRSMEKYSQAEAMTEDPDLIQAAQDGYDEALLGLSRDEGLVGERIIQDAFSTACDGEPAASPAVGFDEEADGKALSCTSGLTIPQDLRPENPGHFRFVVSRQEGTNTVQTCRYQAQHKLIRQQQYWTITLRNAATGGIYTSKTFYGSQPPKCEQVETFYGQTKYKSGSEPSSAEVQAWLEALIP
jgi:tetratricopeptide (TPR) repeat protein